MNTEELFRSQFGPESARQLGQVLGCITTLTGSREHMTSTHREDDYRLTRRMTNRRDLQGTSRWLAMKLRLCIRLRTRLHHHLLGILWATLPLLNHNTNSTPCRKRTKMMRVGGTS